MVSVWFLSLIPAQFLRSQVRSQPVVRTFSGSSCNSQASQVVWFTWEGCNLILGFTNNSPFLEYLHSITKITSRIGWKMTDFLLWLRYFRGVKFCHSTSHPPEEIGKDGPVEHQAGQEPAPQLHVIRLARNLDDITPKLQLRHCIWRPHSVITGIQACSNQAFFVGWCLPKWWISYLKDGVKVPAKTGWYHDIFIFLFASSKDIREGRETKITQPLRLGIKTIVHDWNFRGSSLMRKAPMPPQPHLQHQYPWWWALRR